MTKEEKKELNAKNREIKKDALKAILKFVKENTDDTNLLDAVTFLTPTVRQSIQRINAKSIVADLIVKEGSINEMDLFTTHRIGRIEMRGIMSQLIRKADPQDRIWISFDPDTGIYELVHQGEETPEGWTGYIPVTIQDMEIE